MHFTIIKASQNMALYAINSRNSYVSVNPFEIFDYAEHTNVINLLNTPITLPYGMDNVKCITLKQLLHNLNYDDYLFKEQGSLTNIQRKIAFIQRTMTKDINTLETYLTNNIKLLLWINDIKLKSCINYNQALHQDTSLIFNDNCLFPVYQIDTRCIFCHRTLSQVIFDNIFSETGLLDYYKYKFEDIADNQTETIMIEILDIALLLRLVFSTHYKQIDKGLKFKYITSINEIPLHEIETLTFRQRENLINNDRVTYFQIGVKSNNINNIFNITNKEYTNILKKYYDQKTKCLAFPYDIINFFQDRKLLSFNDIEYTNIMNNITNKINETKQIHIENFKQNNRDNENILLENDKQLNVQYQYDSESKNKLMIVCHNIMVNNINGFAQQYRRRALLKYCEDISKKIKTINENDKFLQYKNEFEFAYNAVNQLINKYKFYELIEDNNQLHVQFYNILIQECNIIYQKQRASKDLCVISNCYKEFNALCNQINIIENTYKHVIQLNTLIHNYKQEIEKHKIQALLNTASKPTMLISKSLSIINIHAIKHKDLIQQSVRSIKQHPETFVNKANILLKRNAQMTNKLLRPLTKIKQFQFDKKYELSRFSSAHKIEKQ